MKKKANIVPPSKENIDAELSQEAIQALRNKVHTSRQEVIQLSMVLDAEDNYDKALTQAAKKLKIDESALNSTFKKNKGELVNKFRAVEGSRENMIFSTIVGTICASLYTILGYVMITEPDTFLPFIFPATVTGVMAAVSSIGLINEFSNRTSAKKSITDQVTQHQNRLPDMTPPHVG